jgi:hypothetical protein
MAAIAMSATIAAAARVSRERALVPSFVGVIFFTALASWSVTLPTVGMELCHRVCQ